ncbi:hypothetical protein H8959_017754 [Pygathrix nigripes]
MDPAEMEPSLKSRRIEGFPFAEETDMYPEFRQSDEENEDPLVPTSVAALKSQLTPLSSSQESYLPPPAYSPRFQPRGLEGPGGLEGRLQATGQARPPAPRPFHHGQYYGYLSSSSPGEVEPPPFYVPEVGSPLSSVMSSPPLHTEGPFGHPTIPEENGENASNSTLPLTQTPTGGRSPEPWGRPEFPFGGLETPAMMFPHQLPPCDVPESLQPKAGLPRGPPPTSLQVPAAYPGILSLEAPKGWAGKSPGRGPVPAPPAAKWQDRPMQPLVSQGQLRHTSQGMGIPVLPYPEPAEPGAHGGPSTFGLDTRWYEPQPRPRPSPRQARRAEPSLHQVVLQPSRLSPLTQSPLSSRTGSPELPARARPRPGLLQQAEMSEITLQPPAAVSFSRKSTPSTGSPTQSSRSGSPSYRPCHGLHHTGHRLPFPSTWPCPCWAWGQLGRVWTDAFPSKDGGGTAPTRAPTTHVTYFRGLCGHAAPASLGRGVLAAAALAGCSCWGGAGPPAQVPCQEHEASSPASPELSAGAPPTREQRITASALAGVDPSPSWS